MSSLCEEYFELNHASSKARIKLNFIISFSFGAFSNFYLKKRGTYRMVSGECHFHESYNRKLFIFRVSYFSYIAMLLAIFSSTSMYFRSTIPLNRQVLFDFSCSAVLKLGLRIFWEREKKRTNQINFWASNSFVFFFFFLNHCIFSQRCLFQNVGRRMKNKWKRGDKKGKDAPELNIIFFKRSLIWLEKEESFLFCWYKRDESVYNYCLFDGIGK